LSGIIDMRGDSIVSHILINLKEKAMQGT